MLLIHRKRVSLTRPVFNPLTLNPLPHAARDGEGIEQFGLREHIYDLFIENASEDDKFNLKPIIFV